MKSHDSNPDAVREKVRAGYSQIALHGSERRKSSCCSGMSNVDSEKLARQIGYSAEDLARLPEGANIGLSCGNPGAVAALRPGGKVGAARASSRPGAIADRQLINRAAPMT